MTEQKTFTPGVELILGPMFSGKSTELLRRMSRYTAILTPTLLVNSSQDTRTDDAVQTHNRDKRAAVKVRSLMTLLRDYNEEYSKAHIIGIDEAQFFDDLHEFILRCEKDSKHVIIAGLDGDFERRPFGQILQCIPLCDSVVKLTAMDMVDQDGTPAIFTKRISTEKSQVCVGAQNKYIAVSRKNYLVSD